MELYRNEDTLKKKLKVVQGSVYTSDVLLRYALPRRSIILMVKILGFVDLSSLGD